MYTEICAEPGVTIAAANSTPHIQCSFILISFARFLMSNHDEEWPTFRRVYAPPLWVGHSCAGASDFSKCWPNESPSFSRPRGGAELCPSPPTPNPASASEK